MQFVLVHEGLLEALKWSKKKDVVLTEKEKTMMIEKTHNSIILSLYDKALRQVSKEKTVVSV